MYLIIHTIHLPLFITQGHVYTLKPSVHNAVESLQIRFIGVTNVRIYIFMLYFVWLAYSILLLLVKVNMCSSMFLVCPFSRVCWILFYHSFCFSFVNLYITVIWDPWLHISLNNWLTQPLPWFVYSIDKISETPLTLCFYKDILRSQRP